ncbi:hypothetical protein BKA62DRAFT_719895 [Auriculariales sp. MPI-PUGE-AT-0066]|nr:hypothetical protein BKA62DRAFT_719895 [Auriculariales sp. MPI-PUGE-AT-0066]
MTRTPFPPAWIAPPNAIVVDDSDNSVWYSEGWKHVVGRPEWYTGSSYHLTYNCGATVSFTFEGTEVFFISDYNDDHGRFSVSLFSGYSISGDPDVEYELSSHWPKHVPFRVPFHHEFPLDTSENNNNTHTIVIKNMDCGKALGVDGFKYVPVPTASVSTAAYAPTLLVAPPHHHNHHHAPAAPALPDYVHDQSSSPPAGGHYVADAETVRFMRLALSLSVVLNLVLLVLVWCGAMVCILGVRRRLQRRRMLSKRALSKEEAQTAKEGESEALLPPAYGA